MRANGPDDHMAMARDVGRDIYSRQLYATLAVAGYLRQMAICGHGTRGFCPWCYRNGFEGTT